MSDVLTIPSMLTDPEEPKKEVKELTLEEIMAANKAKKDKRAEERLKHNKGVLESYGIKKKKLTRT